MDAELYNGYWITTDTYLTQAHREENAQLVYNFLRGLGWTKNSVCAIIGNMDVESSVNPALIEGRHYPNLITNQECLNLTSTGVGMVQWTGRTDTPPAGQKLASYAIRHNKNWYDGELQCERLKAEYDGDFQFEHGRVDGVEWDWESFVVSTETPEQLAKVFQYLYENGGSDTLLRQQKARYYFDTLKKTIPAWMIPVITQKRKELKPQCLRM